jgi:23S rRNA (uracil747-C5)-methyltransferase
MQTTAASVNDRLSCADFAAKTCQSCAWIETPYADQLASKQKLAQAALPSSVQWFAPEPSALDAFRNKAKMAAGGIAGDLRLGLQNPDGSVHDLMHCPLYPNAMQTALLHIRAWLNQLMLAPYHIHARTGELKFVLLSVNAQQQLMLRLVLRSKAKLKTISKNLNTLQKMLPSLAVVSVNLLPEAKAVFEGAEEIVLTAQSALAMPIDDLALWLRPQSFFQTNTNIAAKLYRRAKSWLMQIQPKSVLDLYCGVGGFALHAATSLADAKVLGIELSAAAIDCANASAAQMALSNTRFVCTDAAQAHAAIDGETDMIIVNPPRRGLGQDLCASIEQGQAQHLIYSSCNLESLVRDLRQLPSFRALEGQVLDMFAHTPHFEVIIRLQRS